MKLKFKASDKLVKYNGAFSVSDGEHTPEINEEEAKRLLASWPENFSELNEAPKPDPVEESPPPVEDEVEDEDETQPEKDKESKKSVKDKINKMLGGKKDK